MNTVTFYKPNSLTPLQPVRKPIAAHPSTPVKTDPIGDFMDRLFQQAEIRTRQIPAPVRQAVPESDARARYNLD